MYKAPVCLVSVGVVGCCVGLFLIPFIFNVVLTDIITKMMVIRPSSAIYPAWKDADIPIFEKFYFFEVLNPDEVLQGEKPQLRERGPYVYSIKMPKVNISFHENKTVSFETKYSYVFNESMSVGTEDDNFTMINLPVATMVTMLEDLPGFIQVGMSTTLKLLGEEMFVSMSPKKLLWGYEEKLFKFIMKFTGKMFIPSEIFGLFIGRNNSGLGVFNIETGEKNISELNSINTWKYMEQLPWWDGCGNMINGTDGMMYHPFWSKDEVLYLFNPDLCRSVSYQYKRDTSFDGVPLWLFSLDHTNFANSSEYPPNADFCSENCPPSGTFPVAKCRDNSPISISNPHFFDTNKELQDSVEGLDPNEERHMNYLSLERVMGMPFDLAIRLQLNIQTIKKPSISQTGKIRTLQFPILWFEQNVHVDKEAVDDYNKGIGMSALLSNVMKYLVTAIGALLIVIAAILIIRRKKYLKKISIKTKNTLNPEKEPLLN